MKQPTQTKQSKIDFWSYSSFNAYLTNRSAFKDRYINKIYDTTSSPSAVVGSAAHKALEAYYNEGLEPHEAKARGLEYIAGVSDYSIDYGKTGTRENMLATYGRAIDFYFEELPEYHEILGAEIGMTEEVQTIYGEPLPLPMKGFADLITRNKLGQIEIIDQKFTRAYSDGSVTDPNRFMQAMFMFHLVWAKYGEQPVRMIYKECKTSLNTKDKAGEPQIQDYVIDYEEMRPYFPAFYKIYDLTTQEMNSAEYFLPNFNDAFNGQAAFDKFVNGVTDLEAPVAIKHKTEQVKYQDRKYVASAFDKVENKDLSPEERIRLKLQEFQITSEHSDTKVGPSITKYYFKTSQGVSMKKIAGLENDIKLALEAESIRIEAPVPGTGLVGIEVPSKIRTRVDLAKKHFKAGTMNIPIGVTINGDVVYQDLTKAPHMLVAGTTGAGKSVFLNTTIQSLEAQMSPTDMKLVLIDPKQVELSMFEDSKHLYEPIITDPVNAQKSLHNLVQEMEDRYEKLKAARCRFIDDYNAKNPKAKLPKIVVVIDEFADLMMTSNDKETAFTVQSTDLAHDFISFAQHNSGEINSLDMSMLQKEIMFPSEEEQEKMAAIREMTTHLRSMILSAMSVDAEPSEKSIIRLAQKARAVGIHLILATQRPSADVVTGLIKANIPTKVAFMVATRVNSQVILDQPGAEELIGQGDMLFQDPTKNHLQRLQALYA